MWRISLRSRTDFIIHANNGGFSFRGRSITNLQDIHDACDYIYSVKRDLYKTGHNAQKYSLNDSTYAEKNLEVILDRLSNKIYNYFNKPGNVINKQENFDRFHDRICVWFYKELNAKVRSLAGLDDATYGNAQKMINTLFKYLACFEDYRNFADLFSYCHITIDNSSLRCFEVIGIPGCGGGRNKVFKDKEWHELDREDYIELLKTYRANIEGKINPNIPNIAVDFAWWESTRKTAKGLFALLPKSDMDVQTINKFYR